MLVCIIEKHSRSVHGLRPKRQKLQCKYHLAFFMLVFQSNSYFLLSFQRSAPVLSTHDNNRFDVQATKYRNDS